MLDFQHDASVIKQQHITTLDVVGELLVVTADLVVVAFIASQIDVEGEILAVFEFDRAIGEAGNTNLWALQIAKDGDVALLVSGSFANGDDATTMVFGAAMGEVDSNDINACVHHGVEDAFLVTGRA